MSRAKRLSFRPWPAAFALWLPSCTVSQCSPPETRVTVAREGESYAFSLEYCGRHVGQIRQIAVFESSNEERAICQIIWKTKDPLKPGDRWEYGTLPEGYSFSEKACPPLRPGVSYAVSADYSSLFFSLDGSGNVAKQVPSCK